MVAVRNAWEDVLHIYMKIALEQILLPYPFNNSHVDTEDVTEILTKGAQKMILPDDSFL